MPNVDHSLIYDSGLCDCGYAVTFREKNCTVKNRKCDFHWLTSGGMYSVELCGTDEKAMTTPEVGGKKIRVWHLRLAHAKRTALKRIRAMKVVFSLDNVDL